MHRGRIFNLQRYSVQDGPGIRTTVFLKGCPLRCAWCHNPEGIAPGVEMVVLESRCSGCGECRRVCRFGIGAGGAGMMPPRFEQCDLCGACVEACPTQARRMVGRDIGVVDLVKEIARDRIFFEGSGGGVTFSGGEPFNQPEFLVSVLGACKELGLHTAIDTCGVASRGHLLEAARFTDLFLFDLKLMDEQGHRHFTGVSNREILANLKALDRVRAKLWIRVPIIPGVNDGPENLEAAALFAAGIRSALQVNLLPYHRIGISKFDRLGREASLADISPPDDEAMSKARVIFERAGLNTVIGGGTATPKTTITKQPSLA